MGIERKLSNTESLSCHEGMLIKDLQRSFELTSKALQDRNESIARVTRSLDELVDVFEKAVTVFTKSEPVDRAT